MKMKTKFLIKGIMGLLLICGFLGIMTPSIGDNNASSNTEVGKSVEMESPLKNEKPIHSKTENFDDHKELEKSNEKPEGGLVEGWKTEEEKNRVFKFWLSGLMKTQIDIQRNEKQEDVLFTQLNNLKKEIEKDNVPYKVWKKEKEVQKTAADLHLMIEQLHEKQNMKKRMLLRGLPFKEKVKIQLQDELNKLKTEVETKPEGSKKGGFPSKEEKINALKQIINDYTYLADNPDVAEQFKSSSSGPREPRRKMYRGPGGYGREGWNSSPESLQEKLENPPSNLPDARPPMGPPDSNVQSPPIPPVNPNMTTKAPIGDGSPGGMNILRRFRRLEQEEMFLRERLENIHRELNEIRDLLDDQYEIELEKE